MKNNFYLKPANWIAAFLSCFTMVFAPVSMGQESEKLTKQSIHQTLVELGLDKKITLGEFWEKSKSTVPGYIYKDLEAFVKENKNRLMPEVSLYSSKNTEGDEIPILRFTQNGKIQTVQLYGETNKWAKFNGVTLTARDLERIEDAFKRIEGSDIHLKKQGDKLRQQFNNYKKDFARFQGFPRVTPQLWKSLSKEQRAGYIIKMRLLWMDARRVLAASEKKAIVPAQKTKPSAAIENFLKIIFGEQAFARSVQAARTNNNNTCVVAGYIGVYANVNNINGNNRLGCSIDSAIDRYKNNENLSFVPRANEVCASRGENLVACNPIIYGYPNGSEACIDRRSPEFQHATHFRSPTNNETCDSKSRLSSTEDVVRFSNRDYRDIQPREVQIAAIEADQKKEDYALTNSFLKGVLAKKDGVMAAAFEKGEWNLALDEELVKTQSQFEADIVPAMKTCEENFATNATREVNQKLACDQLFRRWLFTERAIAKLRDKACLKPALYVGLYNSTESSYADSAKEKTALNKRTIDEKGTDLCSCPVLNTSESTSTEIAAPAPKPKLVNFGQSCDESSLSAALKDSESWLPWVLGGSGLAIIGLKAFYDKRKKTKTPNVPPTPACTPPFVGSPPACICPLSSTCTPPQSIYNAVTCQCTNVPTPVTCADNSRAPNDNIAQCPKCPDGSYKEVVSTQKPLGCRTEGGSGNNNTCPVTAANPTGSCSGGLPGIRN
jgi:hypothetical protein